MNRPTTAVAAAVLALFAAACSVEVRVGDVPTEEPTPIGGGTEELAATDLPDDFQEYAVNVAETVFRERDFPGLQDAMTTRIPSRTTERMIVGMSAITGPVVGDTDFYTVIAFRGDDSVDRQPLGDFIFSTRWEEGDGFLRLRVGIEDGHPTIFGAISGLFTPGQTIEAYVEYVRAELGLPYKPRTRS